MTNETEKARLRFVVLFHEFPAGHERQSHWDLMLEQDSQLLTWSLDESPAPGKSISARRLPEHRIEYLRYEGPVSRNRGSVSRMLEGTYFWRQNSEFQVAVFEIESERWEFQFSAKEESEWLIKISKIAC